MTVAPGARILAAEHKYLVVSGIKLHYVIAGQGPVVLLLHGLGTSWVTWQRNIKSLADAGFTVLAPDLPGHGDSDKPESWCYDPLNEARLVYDFTRAMGVERFSLLGNSAGGLMAALLALEHPELIKHLVLVASGGLTKRARLFLESVSLPVLGSLIYQQWFHQSEKVIKQMFHRQPPFLGELLPELRRVRGLPGSREATLQSIRSSVSYFGLKERNRIVVRLKEVPAPILKVWGEKDIVVSVAHAEMFRQELPESTIHVMPGCGHWPQLENSADFNSLLTAFLKGASAIGSGPTGG